MFLLWLICCIFMAVIVELIAGGHGLVLPVFAVVSFYFTVVRGWRRPLPALMVLSSILDLAFGRGIPATLLLLAPVQALAQYWRRYGDCRRPGAQVFPGLLLGFVLGAGLFMLVRFPGSAWDAGLLLDGVRVFFEAVLGSAILLPATCVLLDRGAKAMALPQYRRVRQGF